MSDERKRANEWGALYDAWPEVQPTRGFADRVLAACDAPLKLVREPSPRLAAESTASSPVGERASPRLMRESAPPRLTREGARGRSLRGLVIAAAVAAALLLIPIALHRQDKPSLPLAVAAGPPSLDLGPERD